MKIAVFRFSQKYSNRNYLSKEKEEVTLEKPEKLQFKTLLPE
jgi:hypothetical protein